ncbi:MAG: hypothetical protein DBP02_15060 [gamma proteobacterium symbiont of Ctena orbiculata]|nr:MAG: hypothetical protein DBP02_15060 [gamma proteobacterium symbiont of Ctena orbiculata]
MAYEPFDPALPDPSTENGTQAFDSTRKNLLAIRDGLIRNGGYPGWNSEAQNSDGTTPPTDPDQMDQIVYSRGVERIKLVYTWGTTGGEEGNAVEITSYYSADSGGLYEPLGGVDYPLGKVTNIFDANGGWLAEVWS